MLARMQSVEVGNTVDAQHHGFTVDGETLLGVLQGALDDPRVTVGPIVTAARDQPHAIAVALQAEAVTVVFDLVNPVGAGGHDLTDRGQAELEWGHGRDISAHQLRFHPFKQQTFPQTAYCLSTTKALSRRRRPRDRSRSRQYRLGVAPCRTSSELITH